MSKSKKTQKYDKFLRGRQITYMICHHFRVADAHDAALDLSDLFNVTLQRENIQDFDTRWDQVPLATSEALLENAFEGLNNMKIRESFQLQTVLGYVRPRTGSKSSNVKLSKIEGYGKKTHWSDDT